MKAKRMFVFIIASKSWDSNKVYKELNKIVLEIERFCRFYIIETVVL